MDDTRAPVVLDEHFTSRDAVVLSYYIFLDHDSEGRPPIAPAGNGTAFEWRVLAPLPSCQK